VASVVRLFEALSVTDDSPLAAKRAESRDLRQRNLGYPESIWSSDSGSAIKRTTAGVKADCRWPCQAESVVAFTSPRNSVSERKKNTTFRAFARFPQPAVLAGIKPDNGPHLFRSTKQELKIWHGCACEASLSRALGSRPDSQRMLRGPNDIAEP
jgi:hypothetical protein